MTSIWTTSARRLRRKAVKGVPEVFEVKYLVWSWKRGFLGFYYRAPVVRTAHVDGRTAKRLGRMFTFEDMMKPHPRGADVKEAAA